MGLLQRVADLAKCPNCGSRDVVYTCEPKCCFNHLCSECRTTFQLLTRKLGGENFPIRADIADPESSDATAACALCESLKLYVVANDGSFLLACASCGGRLELVYEDVQAG